MLLLSPHVRQPLPGGPRQPAFTSVLAVWGEGACLGGGDEGGTDCLYCCHSDGSMSVWVRSPGEEGGVGVRMKEVKKERKQEREEEIKQGRKGKK